LGNTEREHQEPEAVGLSRKKILHALGTVVIAIIGGVSSGLAGNVVKVDPPAAQQPIIVFVGHGNEVAEYGAVDAAKNPGERPPKLPYKMLFHHDGETAEVELPLLPSEIGNTFLGYRREPQPAEEPYITVDLDDYELGPLSFRVPQDDLLKLLKENSSLAPYEFPAVRQYLEGVDRISVQGASETESDSGS
jgi:hypothetical protein